MRSFPLMARPLAAAVALLALAFAGGSARADNYSLVGTVAFTNLQKGLSLGEDVPYLGVGFSRLIGPNVQFGAIRPTSPPTLVNATTLTFTGEAAPNPFLPGNPKVHVIATAAGDIHCTWTAVFTVRFINAEGDAVFSGDGAFTVIGGTGKYKRATGTFRTLFESGPVPFGADTAVADVTENGQISRR